ncbi:MAG: hypothetical protein MUC47_06650 [Candidatus Kapabacteria bacterium]|nr:hypothetical protein [Candidatus Kapabacteria bacterium]
MKRPLLAFLLLAVVVARASAQESFAVSTDTVNIGPVLVGTTKQAVLKLTNISPGPFAVSIDASRLKPEMSYTADGVLAATTVTLDDNDTIEIVFALQPTQFKDYGGRITFETETDRHIVEIDGYGVNPVEDFTIEPRPLVLFQAVPGLHFARPMTVRNTGTVDIVITSEWATNMGGIEEPKVFRDGLPVAAGETRNIIVDGVLPLQFPSTEQYSFVVQSSPQVQRGVDVLPYGVYPFTASPSAMTFEAEGAAIAPSQLLSFEKHPTDTTQLLQIQLRLASSTSAFSVDVTQVVLDATSQEATAAVSLTAMDPGDYTDTLFVETTYFSGFVLLSGTRTGLPTTHDIIHLPASIDDVVTSDVIVTDTTDCTIQVEPAIDVSLVALSITGTDAPHFSILDAPALPVLISGSDVLSYRIGFASDDELTADTTIYTATLWAITQSIGSAPGVRYDTAMIPLKVTIIKPEPTVDTMGIALGSVSGAIGSSIQVPVVVQPAVPDGITAIELSVRYNATILVPLGTFEEGGTEGGQRTTRHWMDVTQGASGTVGTLPFRVALGTAEESALSITGVRVFEGTTERTDVVFELGSGVVSVTESKGRTVDPNGLPRMILQVANGTDLVVRFVGPSGRARLRCFDVTGTMVADGGVLDVGSGTSITMPAERLPNGPLFLHLSDGRRTSTLPFVHR